jgi:hypothetical protein
MLRRGGPLAQEKPVVTMALPLHQVPNTRTCVAGFQYLRGAYLAADPAQLEDELQRALQHVERRLRLVDVLPM